MAERCQCFHDGRFSWYQCPREMSGVRTADGRSVCAECQRCDISRLPDHQLALDAVAHP
ncbi:hypothetical protein [Hamadaea tsunoensis]|uniref:hypothetical protein n=1 Tax=Hamadaea tsunoensis TaxID=53368 RepID=UPI000415410E|nr:hypothetical protein [Hamadaea tsunoensis]